MSATANYDCVVKAFPAPDGPKLGDCPFCHRVLLTLHNKQIPFEHTLIDFRNKPEWLIEASQGKVPVLRAPAENLVMPDSDKIVVYLEEKHPEVPMGATDPNVGGKFFPAFRGFLFAPAGSAEEAEKKEALLAELQALNAALSQPGAGPLFGGAGINATDAAVAPKLYHVEVALKHFKNFTIPEEHKALHTYLATIKALPAWKACDYGHDAIIDGWTRHLAAH